MKQINDQNNRIETVCFTGHRIIPKNEAFYLPSRLKSQIEALIERGATRFRAGGAIGFDTVAALCVLELQEKYPQIKLELVLPCRDQTRNWGESDVKVYNYILSRATSTEYVTDYYTSWCMHERNRRLVRGSQVCVAYLAHSGGGSAYTYAFALENGLEVINIYEELK
jgi:uncharacterized phage-like protein YoqJ